MHSSANRWAVIAVGASLGALVLAGCEEKCTVNDSPCAGKSTFLQCEGVLEEDERWVERECPGVEPICVEEPGDGHVCKEGKRPLLCSTWQLLPIPMKQEARQVLHASDLDGNGRIDLLLTTSATKPGEFAEPLVRVMQRSDGSFDAPIEVLPSADQHEPVWFADFDGDQHIDVLQRLVNLTLRFGRADGSFSEPVIAQRNPPAFDFVADLDGDGSAELIGATQDEVLAFGPPPELTERFRLEVRRAKDPMVHSASARDLDGDGRPELIVGMFDRSLRVFTRPEDAWMSDSRPWSKTIANRFGAFFDFNHDGVIDIITLEDERAGRPQAFIETGDGTGKFAKHASRRLPEQGMLWFGDFDGDGNADVLNMRNMIAVLRGRGDGSLETARIFGMPVEFAQGEVVADMNGDGKLDLLMTDFRRVFVAPGGCLE